MKKIISLLFVFSILFVVPLQEAQGSTLLNTSRINGVTAYVGGTVSGSAKVCLSGPGNALAFNPYVNVYNWSNAGRGSKVTEGKLSPGGCLSFNSGAKKEHKVYQVTVSRTHFGEYYFKFYQN
ncbi:hypothetical protein [Sporosarcina aquimarina]|uniref:Uncharacterized protein n=1 Tax=Sporosarcina aquimarina TaxID=114975 RepID=A0ABU4G3K1_9BACL|nr:hypothetical protein [Sporosarcina aquimarina]MDW0111537.1 hypothetical protein [Sporosarcina aquimarina]